LETAKAPIVNYKIVGRTEKAFKIQNKEGRQAFIPRGWVLSMDSEDSITEIKKQFVKRTASSFDKYQERKESEYVDISICEVVEDREKSLKVKIKLYNGIEDVYQEIFLPKFATRNDNGVWKVKQDIWAEKYSELKAKFGMARFKGVPSEAENSYYVDVSIYEYMSEQSVSRRIFVPKSQVKSIDGKYYFPLWLRAKKETEAMESAATGSFKADWFSIESEWAIEEFEILPCNIGADNNDDEVDAIDGQIIETPLVKVKEELGTNDELIEDLKVIGQEVDKDYLTLKLVSAKSALKYGNSEDKDYWKGRIMAIKSALKHL
jgi:hypothetical protein